MRTSRKGLTYASALRFSAVALSTTLAAGAVAARSQILISRQLAEAQGIGAGEVILLSIDPAGETPQPFRVEGIYEPDVDPMKLTARRFEARMFLDDYLSLGSYPADPQALEAVSSLQVSLRDPNDAEAFAQDLTRQLPGIVALPTSSARPGDPFTVLERFHWAVAVVTVAGSAAFLLALMVMRADERREIVGILRVLGFSRRRILLEVLVEGAVLAVAGAVFGVCFAFAMEGIVNRFFQWRYDTPLLFVRVTVPIALRSVAFAVPLGILAGLVASFSLLRLRIGALLRR